MGTGTEYPKNKQISHQSSHISCWLAACWMMTLLVPAQGAVYKCKDEKGRIIYSDTACDTIPSRKTVPVPKSPPVTEQSHSWDSGNFTENIPQPPPWTDQGDQPKQTQQSSLSYEERKKLADRIAGPVDRRLIGNDWGKRIYLSFREKIHESIMSCRDEALEDALELYKKALAVMKPILNYDPAHAISGDREEYMKRIDRAYTLKKRADSYCFGVAADLFK